MPGTITANELISQDALKRLGELNTDLAKTLATIEAIAKKAPEISKGLGDAKGLNEFNKSTKKAGENTAKAVKSITELERIEKKIITTTNQLTSARTKQAQSLAKVNVEKQEQNKLNKENARNSLGLVSAFEKESKRLNELRKQYKNVALSQGVFSKEAKKLEREVRTLDKSLTKISNKAGQFQGKVGKYTNAFKNLASSMGITMGAAGVFMVLKNAVGIISKFEKQMSQVQAILKPTNKEMFELTELAKELGSSTQFTATQVGEAETELGKLGFTVREIIDLTPGVLSLAAASGTDLANAASVAGATVRGFGLDASETSKVVDVMAKSFTTSALDITKFQTAMAIVAPVANSANVSIEETTALLGTLVDAGVDASTAGTGLRNVFLELSKKGLTFEEAMNKILNATDKNKVAMELFGKRGATVGTILAENRTKTDNLTESLKNSAGAAKDMADVMQDNLIGATTKLGSAWEGFILSVDEGKGVFSRAARSIVDDTTMFVGMMKSLNEGKVTWSEFLFGDYEEIQKRLTEGENALKAAKEYRNKTEIEASKLTISQLESKIKKERMLMSGLMGEIEEDDKELAEKRLNIYKEYLNKKRALDVKEKTKKDVTDTEPLAKRSDDLVNKILKDDFKESDGVDYKPLMDKAEVYYNWLEERRSKDLEDQKEKDKDREAMEEEAFNRSMDTANILFDIGRSINDRKIQDIKEQGLTEEEEAKRIAKIKTKQAKQDKAQAIFNTLINTAVAITKVLAQTGDFTGILATIIGVQGAAQVAAIAAQPIPKFKKGVRDFDGGLAEVHKGEIVESGNNLSYIDKPSQLMTLDKGANVYTAQETSQMLATNAMSSINIERNKTIDSIMLGELIEETKELKNIMKRKKTNIINIDQNGFSFAAKQGHSMQRRINRNFRGLD
jgi:hypothetical protein